MKNYEKIVNFVNKKNNVIKIDEFKEAKIGFYYINKLIEDNYISRIGKGLYGKNNCFNDEYYVIQNRYKNAIFSFNTALFFLNKTEVTPNIIDITIPNDYNVSSIDSTQIRLHYTSRENINLGVIKITSPFGNEIKSYNLERTICDIVKNENKCGLDIEQRNKIIRDSFINGNINGTTIIQYAKKLKCEKKIKAIMEVMI
jgi:predicted transcriptional regulator of viral defense system